MRATRHLRRFRDDLPRVAANHAPLTPLPFLERAALAFPTHEAVRHRRDGENDGMVTTTISRDWATTRDRAVSLASALRNDLGCGRGEVVQCMLRNEPEMVEAHFGVPMSGAVLGCINTRVDADTISYVLRHSEAKAFIYDGGAFDDLVRRAVENLPTSARRPILVRVGGGDGTSDATNASGIGGNEEADPSPTHDYEQLLSSGSPSYEWQMPSDEFDAIALNYTSGTTGRPKGCVLHHRGAYLTALGNTLAFGGMGSQTRTRYLWTLPMFHCNGWNFPYTIAAVGGTNVCLTNVDVTSIRRAIVEDGVTHLCGAPIVLQMAIEACRSLPDDVRRRRAGLDPIRMMVAAAPPPASVLRDAAEAGIDVTHVYGLTEVYGPATVCEWQERWDEVMDDDDEEGRAALRSRQGVRYVTLEDLTVLRDDGSGEPVPADGKTLGEVVMRGNQVFKGYYKNEEETERAFRDGYFHTGDLGVLCEDGYVALKDRSKDIIISGGENISSIEVENVLHRHDDFVAAAVVAMPHEKWQEVGCAFVETAPGVGVDEDLDEEDYEAEIIAWCKERMPRFQAPHRVVVGPLPKTSTGKIQKFVLRERAKNMKPRRVS